MEQIKAYYQRKKYIENNSQFPNNFREILLRAKNKFGNQTALNFFEQGEGVQLSFEEVHQHVYQLADSFQSIGIKKGTHVAVIVTNRIEFPLTWLTLAVLGAVMIPVNTSYTGKELDYLLNDSDTEYIIMEDKFIPIVGDMRQLNPNITLKHQVVISDKQQVDERHLWSTLLEKGSAEFEPSWEVNDTDLLNIQYTSGTTGFPKGCMQTQKYWILLGTVVSEVIQTPINSILTDHSFFYMDPQWQLVMALWTGARLNVAGRLSSSLFLERVKKWEVEMAWFPKPLISEVAKPEDKDLPLKFLFIGGGSGENIKKLQDRFGIQVSNAYGMTEIGPGLLVPPEVSDLDSLGTCGLVAPFRDCKIVLTNGEEAGVNEAGELWVKGDGILIGYYNKDEANAKSFVDGWFKTGDKFIQTEKGYYKIIGRFKDMIRRSSENISALEVEYVINQLPQVRLSAVVPVPDDYRGEEVKAYIQLREGFSSTDISPQKIVDYCELYLAKFKVPRYIEYVEDLPLTPTEKVAKTKLVENVSDLTLNSWDRLKRNDE